MGTWSGPAAEPPALFGRSGFDLDEPLVSVSVFQVDPGPVVVLLEAGAGGEPIRLDPDQARSVAAALDQAATVVAQVGGVR